MQDLLGLDVAEVAVRMGIATAVRSHLHKARKHLAPAPGLPDARAAPLGARRRIPAPSPRKENAT